MKMTMMEQIRSTVSVNKFWDDVDQEEHRVFSATNLLKRPDLLEGLIKLIADRIPLGVECIIASPPSLWLVTPILMIRQDLELAPAAYYALCDECSMIEGDEGFNYYLENAKKSAVVFVEQSEYDDEERLTLNSLATGAGYEVVKTITAFGYNEWDDGSDPDVIMYLSIDNSPPN